MTTPRFGEISIDINDSNTTIVTKDCLDSILSELKLDANVWIIWYGTGQHYRTETNGSCINEVSYIDIYLIDNYFNMYKITATCDYLMVLQKIRQASSPIYTKYLFIDIKRTCKYDIPLSNREISYVNKYCTVTDTENMGIFRHKMDDYITLQDKLSGLEDTTAITKPLEDKIEKLLWYIESVEITNTIQSKTIQEMQTTITNMQKRQEDYSGFISYLKKLFAWN